jgi:hypothetical protein
MATLGISTNTRLLGLAIINQGRLEEYAIQLHKSSWSAWKANMIVTSLEPCVRQYCITSVVLSIPHEHHQTKEIKFLLSRIQQYFERQKMPVYRQAVQTFHSLYPPGQKKTKKALMQALCLRYPQLTYCHKKELRNKNKYYIKVFEAVAAATLHDQGKQ